MTPGRVPGAGPAAGRRSAAGGMLLAAALLVAGPGAAGAEAPAVHGELTAGARVYPEAASVGNDAEWTLGTELEVRWRPAASVQLFALPRAWWDPADSGRWRAVPREAWIEGRAANWALRAGRQTFTWGSADTWRPTDVLASWDWGRDFLDPERQGEWALTLTGSGVRWGLEVAYLPVLQGARFPDARSPWSWESALARLWENAPPGLVPPPLVDDPLLPDGVSEQSLGARFRLTRGRTDVYLVGYRGVDRMPLLVLDSGCAPESLACLAAPRVRPAYPPLRLLGLEVQSAVGEVLVKAEATWRDQSTRDRSFDGRTPGLDPNSVQAAAGIDYLWFGALGGSGDLDVVAEVLIDTGFEEASLYAWRPFQRDLAVALTYSANDLRGTVIEAGWIQDLERAESVGTLRIRRRIAPAWTAEVGGDLLLGPPDPSNPFHLFGSNDRLTARLTFGF